MGCMLSASVQAAWPNDKPIELIVGFAPGGGTDVMARVLARHMEKRLGEGAKILVVNKPGSGGEVAAAYVQSAKPDGYTLGMINVPGYVFLPMYRKTAYQPENIRLIARLVDDPAMLVANKDSGKPLSLSEFVQAANNAPTAAEQGFDVQISSERGIGAPRALPDDIAQKLEDAIAQTLKDPAFLDAAKADAPVLALMPGAEWEKRLQGMRQNLQPLISASK